MSKLRSSAYIDPLTGGLTELGFINKNRQLVLNKAASFAIVYMRLPHLTEIQKSYTNDEVIKVFRYVQSTLLPHIGNRHQLARTGPCDFCFIIKNRRENEIAAKLDNISTVLKNYDNNSSARYLTPNYGIYLPSGEMESAESMIKKAMIAALHVSSIPNYQFYDSEQVEQTARDLEIIKSIPNAIKTGEMIVYFQPKIRISDQRVMGAEALIRWRNSREGLRSPDMFLPAVEQHRMADRIDMFVLEETCRTLARWKKQNRELCTISVNLSSTSLDRATIADDVYNVCSSFDISPSLIEFELREDLLMEDLERSKKLIDQLHYYGFRCAADKFGSDVCSLQMLGALSLDSINLDRSFFSGDNNSRHGRFLIESLLRLSAQLQIRTSAVGIDTAGQMQYLRQAACDNVQGFCFFKPMPLEKFEQEVFEGSSLKYVESTFDAAQSTSNKKRGADTGTSGNVKNIILFTYYQNDDSIEFSHVFSPVLGDNTVFKNASALFRTTDLIHENDRADFFKLLERCQRETGWMENTLRFYMQGGRYEWLEVRMHRDSRLEANIISGSLADMSGWKNEVNLWKEKATRDPLTGLYNREYFDHTTRTLLEKNQYTSAAFLFVDVDDFKNVNDTYGHMCGDDVLCYMAKKILGVFRHGDIIARYGGDEFVVFAPSIERSVLIERLDKLCQTFQYPYRNGSTEIKVSASLGAAIFPADGADFDTLLEHADCALYEAKERGKDQFVLYEPYMKGEQAKD